MTIQITNQDEKRLDLIKRTFCKGGTPEEIDLFLEACRRTELDPFARQIYFVKMGGNMTIQTGIDGYRLIAERSKRYMPGREATFVLDKNGKVFSATSFVKKLGPDNQWHEIACTALYSEYKGKGPLWDKMPYVMLAKCAEAAALRKAFPADLSGLYTTEEMEQEDHSSPKSSVPCAAIETTAIRAEPMIGEEEAAMIEELLKEEEPDYRSTVLNYYAQKLDKVPTSFTEIPQRCEQSILRAISKRKSQRIQRPQPTNEDVEF